MKVSRRSRLRAGLGLVALGGVLALSSGAPAAAAPSGSLYVLQGLPGVAADVSVDGARVATAVPATSVVGALRVPAGRHVVEIGSKGRRLVAATVTIPSGGSVDVLAYRAAQTPSVPRLVALRNDLSPLGRGKTRLVVTHAIAGPPADLVVNGKVLVRSVANGESVSQLVPAGSYAVKAVATIGGQTLLPESALTVKAGTLTRVVAIGTPKGAPRVLVHELAAPVRGAGTPTAVHTGSGGQAAALFGAAAAGVTGLRFALLSAALLGVAILLAASTRLWSEARRQAS